MKNTLKNIGAVILGFFTIVVLSLLTDFIFMHLNVFPADHSNLDAYPVWYLIFSLVVSQGLYVILGAYLTTKLAPSYPGATIALGILGLVSTVTLVVTSWNSGAHWFQILIMIINPLGVWLGGKLGKKKQSM